MALLLLAFCGITAYAVLRRNARRRVAAWPAWRILGLVGAAIVPWLVVWLAPIRIEVSIKGLLPLIGWLLLSLGAFALLVLLPIVALLSVVIWSTARRRTLDANRWTDVDRYFSEKLLPHDLALESALESSVAAGLPAISVSPNQGKLLQMLASILGARSILEIGTLGAYSTIWLARGLRSGGRVITLEVDPKHAEVARSNIARAGLQDVVEVRIGSALETLPQLSAEGRGPFDLIFIDADKQNIPAYFEWALKLSRPGALIVVDNVVRDGAVIDADSTDPSVQGVRRFVELLRAESQASGTVIQTVGIKGYDGFAIVIVGPVT